MIKQLAKLAGVTAATVIFAGCTHAAQLPTTTTTTTPPAAPCVMRGVVTGPGTAMPSSCGDYWMTGYGGNIRP